MCYSCTQVLSLENWSHSIDIMCCCFLCFRHCLGFSLCWVLLWQPCCRSSLRSFPLDVGFFAMISKPCQLFVVRTSLKIQNFITCSLPEHLQLKTINNYCVQPVFLLTSSKYASVLYYFVWVMVFAVFLHLCTKTAVITDNLECFFQ